MKNNVATRLHQILAQWAAFKDSHSAISGWAAVFNVEDHSNLKSQLSIYRKLGVLTDQLEHLRNQLTVIKMSAHAYDPTLGKIESALSPLLIAHQCTHVKQHLTPDVFVALHLLGEFLPSEEESISKEDFSALIALINELELTLQDSSLPSSLAATIRSHIALAETAIADYPLRGASALKEAVKYAVGDIKMSPNLSEEATDEARAALKSLWLKANHIADKAIKAEGLAQIGDRLSRFLERLSD